MAKGAFNDPACKDLSDRITVELNDEESAFFLQALGNPPAPTKALRDLMSRPSPWDPDKT